MENDTILKIKEKVLSLPLKPGVYIMKDDSGDVIYVGKAKLLKNRVSSYFQDSQNHSEKTRRLVSQISDFDFIVADSELEALVLECSLIKRHMPKYNILLKDDKGLPFIRIDLKKQYSRFELEPKLLEDGAKYFGPYGGRNVTHQVIDTISEILKLPNCSRKFPRDIGKGRPCLNLHIGRCAGVCTGGISEKEYSAMLAQGVELLDGKFEKVISDLQSQMEQAAEELNFERAVVCRDRISAIEKLGQKQKIISGRISDTDVVGWFSGAKRAVAILHYIDGMLLEKDFEIIGQAVEGEDRDILDAYLTQFYVGRSALPRSILLPMEIDNMESLSQLLTNEAGRKVEVVCPKRGEKSELVKMASANAREEAERITTKVDRSEKLLRLIADTVQTETLPRRIEAYDISTLAGSDTVASMTVFKNGSPYKKDYRRFKIESVSLDDYGSMAEVITRRLNRYLEGDEKFSPLPDLMLIDGGAEHARVAEKIANELGLELVIFGMVKDGRHRTRALIDSSENEIGISHSPQVFSFFGRIQEETHRFAIEYNRSLRKKRISGSELDKIQGIGTVRRKALLKSFKSVKKIREATLEELAEVLPNASAQTVYEYFHPNPEQMQGSAPDSETDKSTIERE